MKKIIITIIELRDIKRMLSLIFNKIRFYFSKPKYNVGFKINMGNWGKNLTITDINKDIINNYYVYTTNKSDVTFTEGLIDFYMKKEAKEIRRKTIKKIEELK